MTKGHDEPWWQPFAAVPRRVAFFVAHGVELLAFVLVLRGVEIGFETIFHNHAPLLFGRMPLEWLIHGADIGLFFVFLYKGLSHFSKL